MSLTRSTQAAGATHQRARRLIPLLAAVRASGKFAEQGRRDAASRLRYIARMLAQRPLGATGRRVSILGFGAEPIGREGRSYDDAERTLHAVLDAGINMIDTASAYGNSEKFIGRGLRERHRRGEFTLVTKCGWTGDWQPAWSPREIAHTIDQSLRDLQTEQLDVLLLHSCELELLQRGEVLAAIIAARDAGKARWIGYSGDNAALRFAIEQGFCDAIECSFNLLDQANAPIITQAAKRGIGVLLKRPIANAVPGASTRPRSDYAAQYWPRWQAIELRNDDVRDVSGGWLEAALRFSAFLPGVTAALIGSSDAQHMRANVEHVKAGPLPEHMAQRLREAFARVGSEWPGLG